MSELPGLSHKRFVAITGTGSTIVCKAATRDPTQRIVITGMGVASCFGNDVDTFYDRYPGTA